MAAGNQGGFNMNDMDGQLRQLEGAYTDSEEDYAEEEEEYDELMDELRTMEQGDSISQLDGADDPVSCNLCDRLFHGKNKGIKLTSHKINVHFKDHFRRVVKDETKRNGFFHCIEQNCSAKQRQKADMFRHLATIHNYIKKFSNMTAGTCPLSVPASMAPNPGPKKDSDLQSLAETEHTNQGIKLTGVFCIYVLTFIYSEFEPAAVVRCDEDGAVLLSTNDTSSIK